MKEAALLLSLQHAVLSDPHPAGRGGRREGRKEGDDTVIKTGENNLRFKQEGLTQPPDSLLPVDLSEEFGTTLSL